MKKSVVILSLLLGISSTFLPWLYFPKVNDSLYGSVGDGVVTGFIFFIVLLLMFRSIYKGNASRISKISTISLLTLNLLIYINKIIKFRLSKENYDIENPMLASAVSGYELGIGVYLLGLSSVISIFACLNYFYSSKSSSTNSTESKSKWLVAFAIVSLFTLILFSFPGLINQEKHASDVDIESTIRMKIEQMGEAFIKEDFDTFIAFNHPSMVQAFGGKRMMTEMLHSNASAFRENNTKVLSIKYGEILDIQKTQSDLQAIVTQEIVFNTTQGQIKENQKLLAIQEFASGEWHFVSIQNKSKEEIKTIFPQFNSKLKL